MVATTELFDRIANRNLTVRRITIAANRVVKDRNVLQVDLFTDTNEAGGIATGDHARYQEEVRKKRCSEGTNYLEGHYASRNGQIGGHKAVMQQGGFYGRLQEYQERRTKRRTEVCRHPPSQPPRATRKVSPDGTLKAGAKIFSPFAALRGFDEISSEGASKLLVKKVELSDEEKDALSDKLLQVKKGMKVVVRYYEGRRKYRQVHKSDWHSCYDRPSLSRAESHAGQ